MCIALFNPSENSVELLLFSHYGWENGGSERLSNLSPATQQSQGWEQILNSKPSGYSMMPHYAEQQIIFQIKPLELL